MTATTATPFYRTAKGSRRHASHQCANGRRSIHTGNPIEIPADQVGDWAPCRFCCPADLVEREGAARQAATAAAQAEKCANVGVNHPQRIYSECRSCGKRGAVNRTTGTLRAHKPQR